LGGHGRVRFEGKVKARPEDLVQRLRKHADDAKRVGMETGQTAGVLFRALKAADVPILCLETRHAHRALSTRTNKTDRNDARGPLLGLRLLLQTKRTLENTARPDPRPGRRPCRDGSWGRPRGDRRGLDPRGSDIEAALATNAHIEAAPPTSERTLCPAK
jgi:hypothetical protein